MGNTKNNIFNKKLGLTLRALREFSSLSREKVSKETGITVSALTSIEDGRKPTAKQLSKLFALYGWNAVPAPAENRKEEDKKEDPPVPEEENGKNTVWSLYTDGACVPNPGKGAYAYVLLNADKEVCRKSSFVPGPTSNNEMELTAVLNGLEEALRNGAENIEVFSDSLYVVNGMSEWIYAWLATEPDLSSRKNGDVWLKLHQARNKFRTCVFHWVKGHDGNSWNEICDTLCEQEFSKRGLPGQEYFNLSGSRFRH